MCLLSIIRYAGPNPILLYIPKWQIHSCLTTNLGTHSLALALYVQGDRCFPSMISGAALWPGNCTHIDIRAGKSWIFSHRKNILWPNCLVVRALLQAVEYASFSPPQSGMFEAPSPASQKIVFRHPCHRLDITHIFSLRVSPLHLVYSIHKIHSTGQVFAVLGMGAYSKTQGLLLARPAISLRYTPYAFYTSCWSHISASLDCPVGQLQEESCRSIYICTDFTNIQIWNAYALS